jgi:hypothetical protein
MPLVAAVLILAGCGAAAPGSVQPTVTGSPVATAPAPDGLYEADATVLEDGTHGPMLCLYAIAESLPPKCGDVPIRNWDWAWVDGEESAAATTWGFVHVVGSYDGEVFTVTETGPPRPVHPILEQNAEDAFGPACDVPSEGGGGSLRSDLDAGNVDPWAMRQRSYVASWVTYLARPTEDSGDMSLPVLYNVVVSADPAAIEAGIRERWDGPLCVVERDVPPFRAAQRIRRAAEAMLPELGLQMLGSDEGDVGQAARISVVADPDGQGQAAMDERFGPGLVLLEPVLQPVQ